MFSSECFSFSLYKLQNKSKLTFPAARSKLHIRWQMACPLCLASLSSHSVQAAKADSGQIIFRVEKINVIYDFTPHFSFGFACAELRRNQGLSRKKNTWSLFSYKRRCRKMIVKQCNFSRFYLPTYQVLHDFLSLLFLFAKYEYNNQKLALS